MSAPTQASAKASLAASGQASADPDAPDRAQLREEYADLGDNMRRWLLGGAVLLPGLLLLWWLLPTRRQLVPTPTGGYRWRQAGTVQDSGTTWVWALADSAGQARLLLSRTQGRTWVARSLGVPAAQARALALGWGSPWRGVLLGERGELRVLPDVWQAPQRSGTLTSPAAVGVALGVDTQGQQLVVADNLGLWHSLDAGQNWRRWNAASPVTQMVFEPAQRRFFAVSRRDIAVSRRDIRRQTNADGLVWEVVAATTEATVPVVSATFEGGRLFIIYQNGAAVLVDTENQPGDNRVLGNYQLFSGLPQPPLALVSWFAKHSVADTTATPRDVGAAASPPSPMSNDSALVFKNAAAGGLIQRLFLANKILISSQQLTPTNPTRLTTTDTPRQLTRRQAGPANQVEQAALVVRAEAAAKDSAFRSRKQNRPATTPRNPAIPPNQSPNQSPVQQLPAAPRPLAKTKD